eukprot:3721149-Prymnesium_polylepis.1
MSAAQVGRDRVLANLLLGEAKLGTGVAGGDLVMVVMRHPCLTRVQHLVHQRGQRQHGEDFRGKRLEKVAIEKLEAIERVRVEDPRTPVAGECCDDPRQLLHPDLV